MTVHYGTLLLLLLLILLLTLYLKSEKFYIAFQKNLQSNIYQLKKTTTTATKNKQTATATTTNFFYK